MAEQAEDEILTAEEEAFLDQHLKLVATKLHAVILHAGRAKPFGKGFDFLSDKVREVALGQIIKHYELAGKPELAKDHGIEVKVVVRPRWMVGLNDKEQNSEWVGVCNFPESDAGYEEKFAYCLGEAWTVVKSWMPAIQESMQEGREYAADIYCKFVWPDNEVLPS